MRCPTAWLAHWLPHLLFFLAGISNHPLSCLFFFCTLGTITFFSKSKLVGFLLATGLGVLCMFWSPVKSVSLFRGDLTTVQTLKNY